MSEVVYVCISPDGFTLTCNPVLHETEESALAEIREWVKRYREQGYYLDACRRQILYDDIAGCCDIREESKNEWTECVDCECYLPDCECEGGE